MLRFFLNQLDVLLASKLVKSAFFILLYSSFLLANHVRLDFLHFELGAATLMGALTAILSTFLIGNVKKINSAISIESALLLAALLMPLYVMFLYEPPPSYAFRFERLVVYFSFLVFLPYLVSSQSFDKVIAVAASVALLYFVLAAVIGVDNPKLGPSTMIPAPEIKWVLTETGQVLAALSVERFYVYPSNPNYVAYYMLFIIFSLWVPLNTEGLSWFRLAVTACLIAAAMVLLLMTQSRGAILTFLFVSCFFIRFKNWFSMILLPSVLSLLYFVVFAKLDVLNVLIYRFSKSFADGFSGRTDYLKHSPELNYLAQYIGLADVMKEMMSFFQTQGYFNPADPDSYLVSSHNIVLKLMEVAPLPLAITTIALFFLSLGKLIIDSYLTKAPFSFSVFVAVLTFSLSHNIHSMQAWYFMMVLSLVVLKSSKFVHKKFE